MNDYSPNYALSQDHLSTDKELLECALIEEMEQIQAYMDKIKENARVQAKADNRRRAR